MFGGLWFDVVQEHATGIEIKGYIGAHLGWSHASLAPAALNYILIGDWDWPVDVSATSVPLELSRSSQTWISRGSNYPLGPLTAGTCVRWRQQFLLQKAEVLTSSPTPRWSSACGPLTHYSIYPLYSYLHIIILEFLLIPFLFFVQFIPIYIYI